MNKLFYGDNLEVLRRKIDSQSVDLCYIDPPFNSKRNYFQIYTNQGGEDRAQAQAFVDTWEWGDEAAEGLAYILDLERLNGDAFGGDRRGVRWTPQTVALIRGLTEVLGKGSLLAYLVHMTQRIVEIHRVLKPTGSFYLHCDPTASHYLKLVCDAVFCGQGGDFVNEISWRRTTAKSDHAQGATHFPRVRDVIFRYAKRSDTKLYHQQFAEYSDAYVASKYASTDKDGRRYMLDNLTGPGGAAKGNAFYEVMGVSKHWRYSKANMERLIAEGRIIQPKPGGVPRYKRYLDEMPGVAVSDDWDDIRPINSQAAERLGYPTQKPEALLERIIRASSNESDVVLDAYCGCGTTVAVAQRLGRRWIGIDITYQSIALILKRFEDTYAKDWPAIEAAIELDGVPKDKESAIALSLKKEDKTRKEFEKWAILTFSRNQARINDKKGADGGIDGVAYFHIDATTNGKAVFQVKSGKTARGDLAKLNSDRLREKAEFGFLICMDMPTKPMRDEIAAAGRYRHPLLNRDDDRLQVVTVAELFTRPDQPPRRLDLPMGRIDTLKAAPALDDAARQTRLEL